jgi:inositol-1,3,4-trisphosphate 5/6-kinase/inositol-tetrakisphosphate 1-kinase
MVTAEEVMPVVDALKRAFGLELFGFDVLITKSSLSSSDSPDSAGDTNNDGDDHVLMVVDVNYFPSYKEVPNFPSLLAKYLTDRAVQSRRRDKQQHQQQG